MEVNPQEWRSIQRNGDQEGNPEEWKSIQKYKVNPEECKVNPQEWKSIEYKAIHRNTRSIHRDGEKTHNILHLHKHIVLFLCPLFSYLYYCLQFLHPILNSPLHHHPLSVVSSSAVFEAHTLYGNTTWHVKTS